MRLEQKLGNGEGIGDWRLETSDQGMGEQEG